MRSSGRRLRDNERIDYKKLSNGEHRITTASGSRKSKPLLSVDIAVNQLGQHSDGSEAATDAVETIDNLLSQQSDGSEAATDAVNKLVESTDTAPAESSSYSTINLPSLSSLFSSDASVPMHGSVVEQEEPRRLSTRKRRRQPNQWKKNRHKAKKLSGAEYLSVNGTVVLAKRPQQVNCSKCRFKCAEKISEDARNEICSAYYALSDYVRQKDFVSCHVTEFEPKLQYARSDMHHKVARQYYLPISGIRHRVCLNFFCKTLDLKPRAVMKSLEKRAQLNVTVGAVGDGRGKHKAKNKTPDWKMELIRAHIKKYPTMESHYCRMTSSRKYLDSRLTIRKMYEQFREFWLTEEHVGDMSIPSEAVYRHIFCSEFNLSFHTPRKDQCNECVTFMTRSDSEKDQFEQKHRSHLAQKERAQAEKKTDKERAAEGTGAFVTASFDMQSLLQIPSGAASSLYYKRKLVVHNLTVYEGAKPNDAYCFVWPETDGKRGSSEIGSILLKYLSHLPESVKEVSLFSDSCSGQNRNQFVAAILLYATQTLPLQVIEQKFLVPGHTQMECDSMHSAIEYAHKYQTTYLMHDWINIMRGARRRHPYNVEQLTYSDFYDLKALATSVLPNRSRNSNGDSVNWMAIRSLRFEKAFPDRIAYKTDFGQSEYMIMEQRRKRGRHGNSTLQPLYFQPLPISVEKKRDLLSLCKSKIIPDCYHSFFQQLSTHDTVLDLVPDNNDSDIDLNDVEDDDCGHGANMNIQPPRTAGASTGNVDASGQVADTGLWLIATHVFRVREMQA